MSAFVIPQDIKPKTADPLDLLPEWERRVILKLRVLRQANKGAILLVKVDGTALAFYNGTPDGILSAT